MFTDVVLKCITQLSSSNGFSDKDILGSLESLRDYAKDMVGKVITRRCHVAVIRLFVNLVKLLKGEELVKETNLSDLVREETSTTLEKRLSTVIGEIQFYDSSDTQESRQQKLQNIRKYFTEEQQKLDQIRKNLINNGENILDENILKPNDRILLYGHSQSVIDMLSGCAKKNSDYYKNLGIFIAECRPKAKHTRANKIEYNDGLEYASKLCRCGYENVVIVPDVAIAHLCISKKNYPPAKSIKTSRKNERKQWFHAEEPVTKIFLGFNGLDIHNNFMIHTCGHLAAVMMAKSDKSEAKVYLVGTSNKCGNVPYDHLKTRDESNWLLVPPDIKSSINLYNPSEDIITFDLVDGIISDIGIFYGEDWSKKFVDEFNKGWENG